jgi:hypothetical protein
MEVLGQGDNDKNDVLDPNKKEIPIPNKNEQTSR